MWYVLSTLRVLFHSNSVRRVLLLAQLKDEAVEAQRG